MKIRAILFLLFPITSWSQNDTFIATQAIETLQSTALSLLSTIFAIITVAVIVKIIIKYYLDNLDNKSLKNPQSQEKQSVDIPNIEPNKSIESKISVQSSLILKDKEIEKIWNIFENKLSVVKSHSHYSKTYINYRTIESLQTNILNIIEPYNNQKQIELYQDIQQNIINALNQSCEYLDTAITDLTELSKKDMKINLLYLNEKLKQ